MNKSVKTRYRVDKEKLDMQILKEYETLISRPGAMKTAVDEILMEKYNLHARSSIWQARKRAEKRLQEGLNND